MKQPKGPAKDSAQWRKEVARARERLRRGWLAALVHGGLFPVALALVAMGSPAAGEEWLRALGTAAGIIFLGWLMRRGWTLAALLLLAGSLAAFFGQLVLDPGLRLSLASIVFAWFYFEGVRGAMALSRRLHAPAVERD